MTITTLAQLQASILPIKTEQHWWGIIGSFISNWALTDTEAGWPVPIMSDLANGPSGTALTSYAGQLPMPPAVGGKNLYIAGVEAASTAPTAGIKAIQAIALYDRLWHSGPFTDNTNADQTVGSVAWPARDLNQSTNGVGVGIALFAGPTYQGFSTSGTFTMSYTNSAGTSGQIGTTRTLTANTNNNHFIPFYLAAGDVGVRSVESIAFTGTPATRTHLQLMAFRRLCLVPLDSRNEQNVFGQADMGFRLGVPLGLPRVFDSSVLFAAYHTMVLTHDLVNLNIQWAQG